MNNFTKEYIREADCELIQDYKKELDYCCEVALKISDREYDNKIYRAFSKGKNNKYLLSGSWSDVVSGIYPRSRLVWLPTGDQLNEEIKQFCMKNPLLRYEVSWIGTCWEAYILENDFPKPKAILFEGNDNPLIAKIKLLKALLKENK